MSTQPKSDTPRTDEQIDGKPCTRFAVFVGDSLRDAHVPSEFARQLERELSAAKATIEYRDEMIGILKDKLDLALKESLEQSRLLGMGGEREAALLGKVQRLERELAAVTAAGYARK